jgi:hypothetical protein
MIHRQNLREGFTRRNHSDPVSWLELPRVAQARLQVTVVSQERFPLQCVWPGNRRYVPPVSRRDWGDVSLEQLSKNSEGEKVEALMLQNGIRMIPTWC